MSLIALILANLVMFLFFEAFKFVSQCKSLKVLFSEFFNLVRDKSLEDKEKQQLLQKKILAIYVRNLILLFQLLVIISPLLFLCFYINQDILISFQSIIISIIFSFVYLVYLSIKKESKNYHFFDKLFHRLVLGSSYWLEFSFDIEKQFFLKKCKKIKAPYFITGLARSGTTALLQLLNSKDKFESISYKEMPLVLAPNIWKRINTTSSRNLKLHERPHKDGILVNSESPEAFEEVFWKMHLKNEYVKENLILSELNEEDIKAFEVFISNFLNSKNGIHKHYLSKNNNQILRIKSLLELMPTAKFIIMFRDPLQHAGALLNQHVNYCKEQKEDSFMLNYMNWIGHYEFGLNQKSFKFDNTHFDKEIKKTDKYSINFWLYSWKNYYKYILSLESKNIFLLSFEDFCKKDIDSMKGVSDFLQFDKNELNELTIYKPSERAFEGIDQELLIECDNIYSDLIHKSKAQ